MLEVTCHQCGLVFCAQRRTAKFCDDACRNAHRDQKNGPQNRTTSPTQARREDEFFDLHMRMCEAYYGLPPSERPAYLHTLITKARDGVPACKRVLTSQVLLRPTNYRQKAVHWRGSRNYPTIAQEAHAYCKLHYGAGITQVLKNLDLVPLTSPEQNHRDIGHQVYEERLRAIQRRVLPGLLDRERHTVKSAVYSIIASHGHGMRGQVEAG